VSEKSEETGFTFKKRWSNWASQPENFMGKRLRQMQRMFLMRFFSYHIAEYHCDEPGAKKPFERFVGTDGDQSLLTERETTEVGSNIIANNKTAWKNKPRM
jgi:hypothetical protein